MSRVNAYLRAGNGNGRQIGMGGCRGAQDSVWATLNTDNASQSDCALHVSAEVCGPGLTSRERRLGSVGDGRRSVFAVELPDQCDQFCHVNIRLAGDRIRELTRIGVVLVGVRGLMQATAGDPEGALQTIEQARAFLAEIDAEPATVPHVTLSGGVTLKHALACVKIVQDLICGTPAAN